MGVWIGVAGDCCLGCVCAQAGGDHFGHAETGVVLDALGGGDDDLAGVEISAQTGEGGAKELGRDDGDDDLGVGDGFRAAGNVDVLGQREAGEEQNVFLRGGNLAGFVGGVRPEGDLVSAAAIEGQSDGGSPGSCAEDGDAAHAVPLLGEEDDPKRDSVPSSRRRMFWWCLAMMMRATANWTAMKKGGRSPRTSIQAKSGKLAAPRMEASET